MKRVDQARDGKEEAVEGRKKKDARGYRRAIFFIDGKIIQECCKKEGKKGNGKHKKNEVYGARWGELPGKCTNTFDEAVIMAHVLRKAIEAAQGNLESGRE